MPAGSLAGTSAGEGGRGGWSLMICTTPSALAPQVRAGEVDHLIGSAADHGFDHVEREALGHLDGDGGRHRQLGAVDDGIDQHRPVMSKGAGDPGIDFGRVLDPDPADTNGFGHRGEVRVLELGAKWEKTGGFLLELDETERAIVEHHDLYREAKLHQAEKVAHQHRETAIARKR